MDRKKSRVISVYKKGQVWIDNNQELSASIKKAGLAGKQSRVKRLHKKGQIGMIPLLYGGVYIAGDYYAHSSRENVSKGKR